jgi:hypothetical protein
MWATEGKQSHIAGWEASSDTEPDAYGLWPIALTQ